MNKQITFADFDLAVNYINWLIGRRVVTDFDIALNRRGLILFKIDGRKMRQSFNDQVQALHKHLGRPVTQGAVPSSQYARWSLPHKRSVMLNYDKGDGWFIGLTDARKA